ncbi:hypothetical protein [Stenotrophomonas oahuensis]|uniref:Uncharacterized protein n=1 Tax=Stenotrophomonas oahuensis TaxID=3003271 RepID=A0ABY9YUK8_9GAMM|nr:hypothetical protein [Stenotrophomonas sp. A5586]WNH53858.1 hypothetical protein PDM29_06145 [Stenotrophomonas sp. A5586]
MTEEDVRQRAETMLSELMKLDALATSDAQRRSFKEAREYLCRAAKSGLLPEIRIGSYWFAVVSDQIRVVQDGRLKGEQRAAKRAGTGKDSA